MRVDRSLDNSYLVVVGKTEYMDVNGTCDGGMSGRSCLFNFFSGIGTRSSLRIRIKEEILEFLKKKIKYKMLI